MMKIRKEYLHKDCLPTNILRSIQFFSIAEEGAMGTPGEVVAIAKAEETIVYLGNYCYGDLKYTDIQRFFSPLKQFKPGLFGEGSIAPKGWIYGNLGMGNHLLVRSKIYPKFKELVGDIEKGELHQDYLYNALIALGNTKDEVDQYYQNK